MHRNSVYFTVNGKLVKLDGGEVFAPLSDTLRYRLRFTGTKVVCAEGDCGACTVMMARSRVEETQYRSINSCIFPSFLADGCHFVTVEGLGNSQNMHEIQSSMVRNFGGQCGFCTPGFVMSLANMFEHKCEPSEQNIKNYLTGNLCRCTGYQPIINAAKGVQADRLKRVSELYPVNEVKGRLKQECKSSLYIETGSRRFFAPVTLAEALEFKKSHPGVRIFSGATDLGVQINKGKDPGPMQMSLHLVDELYALSEKEGSIEVGARVTLDQLQDFIEDKIPELAKFLNIFASPQIKNSATLVGNLANGSPIADTTPALMVLDAQVELASVLGVRSISVAEFFKGYKEFHVHPDELITRIRIPAVTYKKMGLYKISQRRDLDISCVNAAFLVQSRSGQIQSLKIAFGGVAATPLRLKALESEIPNQRISNKLIDEIQSKIEASVQPLSDVRGSSEFRKKMAGQLWRKFAQEHLK